MRIAECGIRTTYNLRNIPHKNFRKIYVIKIPQSAKYTDPEKYYKGEATASDVGG